MRRRIALATAVAAVCVCVAFAEASAGHLSAGLERLVAAKTEADEIPVLIVLREQAPLPALDADLRASRASRAARHRAVVDALRAAASRSQGPLLAELERLRLAGRVRRVTPYWILNAIAVDAPPGVVRGLAARADVDVVEAQLPAELIPPSEAGAGRAPNGRGARGVGITPGLLAIEADRVWNELGIDGTGALVGNMDTGVDGTHPALAARWRGNFAPASECWRDGAGFGDAVPIDRHYHGTHVMGTICGRAPGDTIGVAPGALWIADNSIHQGVGPTFDSDVLTGLQWFADPDGNSSTSEDVPDVVQHSWGINESVEGYVDCDARWWTAIDACEAAGVVLVWSAGTEGPESASIRSPADRAASAVSAFAVGATGTIAPYTISSLSSRGPSGCGGEFEIKPEVTAPGELVYSAEPGGGYRTLSGTSMAGPHVAGVVALMRSANPDLEVQTIQEILLETAVDLGDPGEDNTYGHGIVNAYDAVSAALEGFGRIEGTLTDAATTDPIPNVLVEVVGDPRSTTTDESGFFRIALPPGIWTLEMSSFGYTTDTQIVEVFAEAAAPGDFALSLAPTAVVSGTVRDFLGAPVQDASVTVLGTPVPPAVSLGDGTYSIVVPDAASYTLRARRDGLGSQSHLVAVSGPVTRDFTLPQLTGEDFESGDFEIWPWTQGGDAPWTIDATSPHEGSYAARSGPVGHSQKSTMEVSLSFAEPGTVSFWIRTSSQDVFDLLRFSIDGVQVASWSGLIAWKQVSFPVAHGPHTLRWSYTKDGSWNFGADAVWVDVIEFPAIGIPDYPDIVADPGSLTAALEIGETAQAELTLTNTGSGPLEFTASIQNVGPAAHAPAPRNALLDEDSPLPAKGEADARVGSASPRGGGGPDAFGYRWADSDDPSGPVFQWVEINDVGTLLNMADDTYTPPRFLGFFFPFYGANYSSVRISANGFLSFTSPPNLYYGNTAIPDPVLLPHGFVAAYWDDLTAVDGGEVYTFHDVPNERFIVEWDGVPIFGSNGTQPQTFQILLYTNGTIVVQYKSVTNATACTAGIESPAGDDGLQVTFNASYLHSGLAIRYSPAPPPSWLSVSPPSGEIPPGDGAVLDVSYDATGLAAGTYEAVVRIVSNDPDAGVVNVPVTLTVTDATGAAHLTPLPKEFALAAPEPNPFSGRTTIRFAVPVEGRRVAISVFDVAGRRVRSLVDGPQSAGRHDAVWDGRDAQGRRVGSGVYFFRMEADAFSQVKKVSRLR